MEAPTVNVMDEELVKAFFKKVGEFHHLTTPGSTLYVDGGATLR